LTFASKRVLNIYEFGRFEVIVSSKLKYVFSRDIQVAKSVEEVAEAIANIRERRLDAMEFSDQAIELAITLSPLIGMELANGKCHIVGGLRSLYLVKQLDGSRKVPVLVVPHESIANPKIFAAQSALVDLLMRHIDGQTATTLIPLLWDELEDRENRMQLSPRFTSKSGLAEAAGINRRKFAKNIEPFQSEFLALGGDTK